MTDKLEDTSLRLKDEMDLYRKMMDKLRQNRQQFQKEKEEMQEVGGLFFSFCQRLGALFVLVPIWFCSSCAICVVDRRPASRAGAFAHVQAGDREARTRSELFLRAVRLHQQDQGGGAGARSQEAQTGSDETVRQYRFSRMCVESWGCYFYTMGK